MPTVSNNAGVQLSPLANPFNTRMFGNFSVVAAQNNKYVNMSKHDLQVPDSTVSYDELQQAQAELHVPNQDVPLGCQCNGNGFIEKNIFRCADGTIINLKTHKVVKDPTIVSRSSEYWNDPSSKIISMQSNAQNWNDDQTSIHMDTVSQNGSGVSQNSPIIDGNDYWKNVQMKSVELQQNMSQKQHDILRELSANGFFDSKLIDESKQPT